MPPNMKTLIAKYRGGNRRFSCSASNSAGSNGAGQILWSLRRFISFGFGYGLGMYVLGDKVAEVEEDRQKYLRDVYGESSKIVDLRQEMWKF
ncbi:unnamed protein product [Eruca vesicaria subsp. sativa]|uniref:Uncharacterized protein n=1 Tax=Eruca vesicaria subsp. sativa TaxID=29727 RepID=A0ABC8JFK5_ERUVS|nr:unnamed protein product [Eruca vesicaria subsp. sativa]